MTARALVGALVLAAAAAPAVGQSCGVAAATGLAAGGGVAHYELGDGLTGPAVGADLTVKTSPRFEARAGYRLVLLDAGPDPHLATVALGVPLVSWLGLDVCVTGHAGGSWLSTAEGDALVAAGGGGLRAVRPFGSAARRVAPYVEVRALAGRSAGELAEVELDAAGQAVGGEAGLLVRTPAVLLRAAGSLDGFDAGLGLPPYPRWSGTVSVGIRF